MFEVYNSSLSPIGRLEAISSASWTDSWQELGIMSLTLAETESNLQLLQPDNLITADCGDGILAYLIINVSRTTDSGTMTVNCKSADFVLHRRCVSAADVEDTTVQTELASIISSNLRGIPMTVGGSVYKALPAYSRSSGPADEAALDVLQSLELGRRIRISGSALRYIIDAGRDRTAEASVPVFGIGSGHYAKVVYADDQSEGYNVAVGRLVLTDDTYQEITEGATSLTGIARREYSCGDFVQKSSQTAAECEAEARTEMQRILRENAGRITLTARIDWDEFGTLYKVGDLLRTEDTFGAVNRRITSASWTWDSSGKNLTITLGQPIWNVLKEINRTTQAVIASGGGRYGSSSANSSKEVLAVYKELVARLTNAEAGIQAVVVRSEDGSWKAAETKLYAAIGDVEARLDLYVTQSGATTKTFATLLADIVKINNKFTVDSTGVRIDSGSLTLTTGSVYAYEGAAKFDSVYASSAFYLNDEEYKKRTITSTDRDLNGNQISYSVLGK